MKRLILLMFHLLIISTILHGESMQRVLIPSGTEIRGFIATKNSYFFIEENWDIDKYVEVEVDLSFSELTRHEDSTISYYINNRPLTSLKMKNIDNSASVVIKIPKNYIKFGVNEFSIKKMQKLSEDNCNLDEINPANWVRVNKALLTVNYQEDNSKINLSNYPLPFMNQYEDVGKKNIYIAMHKNSTNEEKKSLTNLAAFLGQINKNSKDKIEIIDIEKVGEFRDNYIVISEYERLPLKLKEFLSESDKKHIPEGLFLRMVNNPANPKKKILIQTSISRNIGNGLNWLIDKKLLTQISGDFSLIKDYSENKYPNISLRKKITFKSKGIPNIKLSGISKIQESVILKLPKDEERENVILNLNINFSDLVKENKSTLKVSVNGVNLWDKELKVEGSNYKVSIPIPNRLRTNNSEYYIEFESNYISEFTCSGVPSPWIEIENDSYIESDVKERKEFAIRDFTAPFVKGGKYNNLAISSSNDFESLQMLGEIFRIIGADLKQPTTISYIENNDSTKNAIIVGQPHDNKILEELSSEMFLKYSRDKENFLSDSNFQFLGDNIYSGVQLLKDKESYKLLVFTDKNNYYDNLLEKIKTNVILSNSYIAINLKEGVDFEVEKKEVEVKSDNIINKGEAFKIFALLVLAFGIMALFLIKKGDKDDDEK